MPCFSASNPRFSTVEQQQKKFSPKDHRSRSSREGRPCSDSKKQCQELLPPVRGYSSTDLNKRSSRTQRSKPRQGNVPSTQALLPPKEFERLKTAARVVKVEERLDALMKEQQEIKRLAELAESTRERFKKIDDARKRAAETNVKKVEVFGEGEKLKVLERSFIARAEQEQEVKEANSIIINAKCHAIREAQIHEKTELNRQERDEQIRSDKAIIENAIMTLNREDEKVELAKVGRNQYAKEIRKQLEDRENMRLMEARRLEQEALIMKKANEAMIRDDERQAKLDRERRAKFNAELARISEMSALFKRMLCEQERELDMRAAAYNKAKDERERALKAEKRLEKEELERKQQRIFILGQKMLEAKSNREETAYLRDQEMAEREYRRKEKLAAMRKLQLEKEIKEARRKQQEDLKHRQALQIARAEQDFIHLMEQLKQDEAKQKEIDAQVTQRRQCYRTDIIRQMSDKELERRRLLELEHNRVITLRDSDLRRAANIKAVIDNKLQAMRDACLPEKYVKDVEKKIQKVLAKTK